MTDDSEPPKTTHWDLCAWTCPRCGLTGNDGLPAGLQLIDSRDPSISSSEIWDPEFSPSLYDRANATQTAVYCHTCDTVFDVDFEPREEDSDD